MTKGRKKKPISEWRPHALETLGVSEELWQEFLRHRRTIKKPMTDYAQYLALRRLWRLRREGNDPVAVVQQSIEQGWQGLFAVHAQGAVTRPRERGSAGLPEFE